jgi:hypothetical protein
MFYGSVLLWGILWLLGYGGGECCSGNEGSDSSVNIDNAFPTPEVNVRQQAIVSWTAPETRVNGDVISRYDLASYEIRYGKDAASLNSLVIVDRVGGLHDLSFTIEDLSAGTWYFTIQARDENGLLSSPSEMVNKVIQG